jgi:hypothetical protein
MATECYIQLGFGFQLKLVVDFAGPHAGDGAVTESFVNYPG